MLIQTDSCLFIWPNYFIKTTLKIIPVLIRCLGNQPVEVISAAKEQIITGTNIAVPTETVWADLSKQLNNKVSPKNLYTIVKTNRHNIWQILELCKINTDTQDQGPNCDSSQESSADFHSAASKAVTKQSMLRHYI